MGRRITLSLPKDKVLDIIKKKKADLTRSIGTDEQTKTNLSKEINLLQENISQMNKKSSEKLLLLDVQEEYLVKNKAEIKVIKEELNSLVSNKNKINKEVKDAEKAMANLTETIKEKTKESQSDFVGLKEKKKEILKSLDDSIGLKKGELEHLISEAIIQGNRADGAVKKIEELKVKDKELDVAIVTKMARVESLNGAINKLINKENEALDDSKKFQLELGKKYDIMDELKKDINSLTNKRDNVKKELDGLGEEKFLYSNVNDILKRKKAIIEKAYAKAKVKVPKELEGYDKIK